MSARVSLARDLALETAAEPIQAWRAWALSGRRDHSELTLRPVAGRSRPWAPLEPAQAVCKLVRMHRAPHPDCSCGLHGTHDLDILRKTRAPAVLGRVALWGRVIEHELGFRAEYAYPQRLRLICQFCFWQWGPFGQAPQVVGLYRFGEMIPLCEEHFDTASRYGMIPRHLMAAATVEQSLRDRYAVDVLAI